MSVGTDVKNAVASQIGESAREESERVINPYVSHLSKLLYHGRERLKFSNILILSPTIFHMCSQNLEKSISVK